MHTTAELTEAGAEFVALWPQEVLSHLLGDDAAREPTGACAVPGAPAPPPAAGCGCGCRPGADRGDDGEEPGARRRRRRREASATLVDGLVAGRSENGVHGEPRANRHHDRAADDVLEAMRRICRAG
jgi:phosphoglycolate phosphatase